MSERLSAVDVAKVARMARLNISAADVERYTQQLDGMLDHFADIDNLQLADVQPMTQPFPLVNVLRADVEQPCLDQIGPFSHSVADAALLTEVIAGHDPMDSTSIPKPAPSLVSVLGRGVEGMRIGRVADLPEGADADVLARLDAAFIALEKAGATIVDVKLPSLSYALTAYYLIAPAEASSNLARYDGVRYGNRVAANDMNNMYADTRAAGFGDEVKRRIMLGTYALSAGYYDAYYGKALKVRRLISNDFAAAYANADVILTPTSPTVAFPFGAKTDDPLTMYLCDIFTIPTNLAGHPAMSVPFGTGQANMPVGVQILAPTLGEEAMFKVAAVLESAA